LGNKLGDWKRVVRKQYPFRDRYFEISGVIHLKTSWEMNQIPPNYSSSESLVERILGILNSWERADFPES